MNIVKINHLTVVVKNFEKACQFYEGFLGCTHHKEIDSWFYIPGTEHLLHVIDIEDAEVPSDEDMFHYYTHFALEVQNLRKVLEKAILLNLTVFQMDSEGEEHQIQSIQDDLSFGIKTLFIRDYDNNLWEFIQKGFSWDKL